MHRCFSYSLAAGQAGVATRDQCIPCFCQRTKASTPRHRAMSVSAGDGPHREAAPERVTRLKQTVRVRRKGNIKGKRQWTAERKRKGRCSGGRKRSWCLLWPGSVTHRHGAGLGTPSKYVRWSQGAGTPPLCALKSPTKASSRGG